MNYYLNKNAQSGSGDHEVHTGSCSRLPQPENRTYLGDFSSGTPAVTAAKKIYVDSNGCYSGSTPAEPVKGFETTG